MMPARKRCLANARNEQAAWSLSTLTPPATAVAAASGAGAVSRGISTTSLVRICQSADRLVVNLGTCASPANAGLARSGVSRAVVA